MLCLYRALFFFLRFVLLNVVYGNFETISNKILSSDEIKS